LGNWEVLMYARCKYIIATKRSDLNTTLNVHTFGLEVFLTTKLY